MHLDHWKKLPNGDVQTTPMTGWRLLHFPLNVLIQIQLAAKDGKTELVQLHIPAAHVDEFALALRQSAAAALAKSDDAPHT